MKRKTKTVEEIDAALARWQTRLKRAVNTIDRLTKQKRALERKAATAKPKPLAVQLLEEMAEAGRKPERPRKPQRAPLVSAPAPAAPTPPAIRRAPARPSRAAPPPDLAAAELEAAELAAHKAKHANPH